MTHVTRLILGTVRRTSPPNNRRSTHLFDPAPQRKGHGEEPLNVRWVSYMGTMWAAYYRASDEKDDDPGKDFPYQRRQVANWAKFTGSNITAEYKEIACSADPLQERKMLLKIFRRLNAGELTGVVMSDQSRLCRNPEVFADIARLRRRHKWKIVFADQPNFNWEDPTERQMLWFLQIVNASHSWNTSAKMYKFTQGRREQGLTIGRPICCEPSVHRKILKMAGQGWGDKRIASALNELGIEHCTYRRHVPHTLGPWSHSTVKGARLCPSHLLRSHSAPALVPHALDLASGSSEC